MKLRECLHRRGERGQTLIMLTIMAMVLFLFAGLAIDGSMAYLTKADLAKAVDAACLAGMRNRYRGESVARTVAQNAFNANYAKTDLNPKGRSIRYNANFATDPSSGNRVFNVSATADIKTFFMRLLPGASITSIAVNAQSTRADLIMSLVLDRSGSMTGDGGASALPPAVTDFVSHFDNNLDQVAMVSFAGNDTVNVAITYNFIDPITTAVNALNFVGATYAYGGLVDARAQNNVTVPAGRNVVKAVVFFTDGIANTVEDNLSCPGFPLINYGGNAPTENTSIAFMNPATGNTQCSITDGGHPSCCVAPGGFPSQKYNTLKPFTRDFITQDAEFRTAQLAALMRAETPHPTVIYSIGLGTDINIDFLKQLANTSDSSTYDSTQPSGKAYAVTSCPSGSCTSDLQNAFDDIANDLLLRLTK